MLQFSWNILRNSCDRHFKQVQLWKRYRLYPKPAVSVWGLWCYYGNFACSWHKYL